MPAPALEAIGKLLTDYKDLKVELGGHTDDVGDRAYNQKLSEQRVGSVKAWLVKKGIVADRMTTRGYADTEPVVPTTRRPTRPAIAASSSSASTASRSEATGGTMTVV